jgi:hypothetical protein
MKWGHFFECNDEKRTKVAVQEPGIPKSTAKKLMPLSINIPSGETVHLCTTGLKYTPTGIEGRLNLVAVASDE